MKVELCKPVEGGMTEQEKCEAGFLYNPNVTDEMKTYRFKIQDAMCEYNKLKPSQVQERRDFLAGIFGKIGKKCNILPPFKCDYGFHIEVGENFFANYNFIVLDGNYVRIGDNVWIAPNVGIYAAGHPLLGYTFSYELCSVDGYVDGMKKAGVPCTPVFYWGNKGVKGGRGG